MPDHGIVVVGASAGGVEALADLAASLPGDLPAAVFVVLHLPATGTSALPEILRRHGPLPAAHVKDGEPIQPGRVYVAPPDHHVLAADRARAPLPRPARERSPACHRPVVPQRRPRVRDQGGRGGPFGCPGRRDRRTPGHQVAWRHRGRPGPRRCALPGDAGQRARAGAGRSCPRRGVHGQAPDQAGRRPAGRATRASPGRDARGGRDGGVLTGSLREQPPGSGPRGSRVPTATACSGRSGTAAWSGTAAGSATPGRRKASSPSRARPWRRPCGSPCGAWRSGPLWPGGWLSRPAAVGIRSRRPGSRSRRPRPSRRPGSFVTCCWTGAPLPSRGRAPATVTGCRRCRRWR